MKNKIKNILLISVICTLFVTCLLFLHIAWITCSEKVDIEAEVFYAIINTGVVCAIYTILGYTAVIIWATLENHTTLPYRKIAKGVKPMFNVLRKMLTSDRDAGIIIAILCDLMQASCQGVDERALRTLTLTINDYFTAKYNFDTDEVTFNEDEHEEDRKGN